MMLVSIDKLINIYKQQWNSGNNTIIVRNDTVQFIILAMV